MKPDFYSIHHAVPRRLVSALRKTKWNRRALARQRNINISYLEALLNHGHEPTDKTPEGQRVRSALFLPRHKTKPHIKPPLTPHQRRVKKQIAKMALETRHAISN